MAQRRPFARPAAPGTRPAAAVVLASALLLAACQGNPDSWGTGVVKQSDAFGDYSETVVNIPRPTAGPRQFQCAGPFAPNTSAVNIAADFGQANVVTGNIISPDGSTSPGLVLLPNDPALSLEIAWKDAIDMVNPRRVAFTESSAWSVNGIAIGSTLADLEKANGKPFRVQGFGGNGGGVVADWRGGRLGNLGGGCTLGVQLALSATASDQSTARLSGPRSIASSDATLRAAAPTVGVFWVNYR
ncbi:hypothetical protein V5F34_10665 [Xanthobacter autotrophicus]|jgi:hypothetical protein|uniref:Lipoprotein n=1 Tax=Xanthobacter autotrophicus TaxID=280 RepID=A0A6C1KUU9_XANAU|nr:hypothetical protein [Xanthobacter autotrophicus]TLX44636.1 hypothetical protein FBQ73_02295 [Xanthobacter autotrophicus]